MATDRKEVIDGDEIGTAPEEHEREPQGTAVALDDPEPHPEPIHDGAALLNEVMATVLRFVVLPRGAAVTITLWIAMTYLVESVRVLPRLLILSPTKACGKTRLLTVLGFLVRKPLSASGITPAALFRAIEKWSPTVLLDEMDNGMLHENPEMRSVLNSGHTRGAARTYRVVGDGHEVRQFSTWAPVALACIGKLPDTVMSRCVRDSMKRRGEGEAVERMREYLLKDELEPLRRRLRRWARDRAAAVRTADPDSPRQLGDRDADNWMPLLVIADAAGGQWPTQARSEALAASGSADESSTAELLLADIRGLFEERGVDRLASADVVAALMRREGRPWADWSHGRGLSPNGLARLLRGFEIEPGSIRLPDGRTPKGYHREQFAEVWERYLPGSPSENRHIATTCAGTGEDETFGAPQADGAWRLENATLPADEAGRGTVADEVPSGRGREVSS